MYSTLKNKPGRNKDDKLLYVASKLAGTNRDSLEARGSLVPLSTGAEEHSKWRK
jgi:hypothetical protein